jgi:hypothetical protein
MVRMTTPTQDAAAERLRQRYPRRRLPRPLLVVIIGLVVAVAGGWLIWSALFHANPATSARVSLFTVRDDRTIDATLTVERRDPSVVVTCRVVARAADFQSVGEVRVSVPASAHTLVDLPVTITTLRRATTAEAKECSSG